MDGVSQVGTSNSANTDVSALILRKALKAEQEAALGLIDVLTQQISSNPPNFGQDIDVTA